MVVNLRDDKSKGAKGGGDTNPMLREILDEVKRGNKEREEMRKEFKTLAEQHVAFQNELLHLKNDNENFKKKYEDDFGSLRTRNEELSDENETLKKCIMNQQRFLEEVDAQRRQCNLVVLGVQEESDALGNDDSMKVASVLNAIGVPNIPLADARMKRLGVSSSQRKRRPLLIEFSSAAHTKQIMEKASTLKDYKGEHKDLLKKVFIKRDMHPVWRKEHDRLFKLAQEERKKPENTDIEIKYDKKKRVLTRNGLVVDRFNPSFL